MAVLIPKPSDNVSGPAEQQTLAENKNIPQETVLWDKHNNIIPSAAPLLLIPAKSPL